MITKLKKLYYTYKLRRGVLTFTFIKRDGTTRILNGTLRNAPVTSGGPRYQSDKHITVYDVDKLDWRTIRLESILEVNKPCQ